MQTYIALLRGINVSGHNKIKMVDLRLLFNDLKFNNVTTYIQSGNVIFTSSEKDISKIEREIKEAIKKKFDYDVKVLIITKNTIQTVFASNPFMENSNPDITKMCVTFLSDFPESDNIKLLEEYISNYTDEYKINEKHIFLHCPIGFAKTKLTNNLIERKLKVDATSRNWKTITKLVELSNEAFE
tara:strand:+ start:35651 stop:36205 length:555 start_codon:yes stop_codon:yes gene_type:complete